MCVRKRGGGEEGEEREEREERDRGEKEGEERERDHGQGGVQETVSECVHVHTMESLLETH